MNDSVKNTEIVVQGARAHNLKNIDVTIPRDKIVVVTGLSGSLNSSYFCKYITSLPFNVIIGYLFFNSSSS